MSSFCDLNLNVTNLPDKLIDQLVEQAIKLGYDHLALAIDFEFPQAITHVQTAASGGEKGGKKGANSGKKNQAKSSEKLVSIPNAKPYKLPKYLQDRLDSCARRVKIYSRLTVKIRPTDINTHLHHLRSKPVQTYDLVALEPLDHQVLLYLCANNFNADIISINSGIECKLIDKHLMRPLRNAVNSFSLKFELNYSPSVSSSTERRDFIMAGRCLSFNVKSKGLIINSGCSQKLGLRGPYEILNLIKLFDIKDAEAHQIIRRSPHDAITNSFCRKHTASGMVYFKDPANDLKSLETALIKFKEKCSNERENEISKNLEKEKQQLEIGENLAKNAKRLKKDDN